MKGDMMNNEDTTKDDELSEDGVVFEEEGETSVDTLKKLREKLKICQKEREEYLAGWQRAKADYLNARKEENKSRADFVQLAKAEVVAEFLPVADNLDHAMGNKEAWEKVDKNWRVGIEYIYAQLIAVFEQQGLRQLDPLGEVFDPAVHTSVRSVPAQRPEDDHVIVAVIQKGYVSGDSVIRSPKVEVAVWDGPTPK